MLVTQAHMRGQYDDVVFIKEELNHDWPFAASPAAEILLHIHISLFSLPNPELTRIQTSTVLSPCTNSTVRGITNTNHATKPGSFVIVQRLDSHRLHLRVRCSPVTSRGTVSCSSLMPTTTSQRYRPESLDRRPFSARLAL